MTVKIHTQSTHANVATHTPVTSKTHTHIQTGRQTGVKGESRLIRGTEDCGARLELESNGQDNRYHGNSRGTGSRVAMGTVGVSYR